MKLKNTSSWPDKFLRRLIRVGCQKWGHKMSRLREVRIRKGGEFARDHSGRAYLREQEFVGTITDTCPVENVASLIIHEVGHLAIYWKEAYQGGKRDRDNGRGWGGSEEYVVRLTAKFLEEIKDDLPEWLEAEKLVPIPAKSAIPKPTAVEKREFAAIKGVARSLAKIDKFDRLKRAAEKRLKAHEAKVRYYAKRKTEKNETQKGKVN